MFWSLQTRTLSNICVIIIIIIIIIDSCRKA